VNRALYAAASGMAAQQQSLDVIADNLANADVPGFKGKVATFASLGGNALLGAESTGTRFMFEQGKLMKSGGPFDCAIDGAGFFIVERDGRTAYTRAGSFSRRPDGTLVNPEGWRLRGIRIPQDVLGVDVASNGDVIAAGAHRRTIGRIKLAAFDSPEQLRSIGSALFMPTAESGSPRALRADPDGSTKISFGMLEKSNVGIIEAMMEILAAQRAYEANAKGVQAADEMQRIANNLHRT
jgi:flagellar basal-body rod protein FlgG